MAKAKIEKVNGSPAIMIDGMCYPPMAMTVQIKNPTYLMRLGESGLKLYFLMANTDWMRPPTAAQPEGGFARFCADAKKLLACVPDAYIIVRVGMHPPVSWMQENPDELMTYEDGTQHPCIISSEIHSDEAPGMYTLCSQKWREDGAKALRKFCNDVKQQPFADRVIGYFLAAGGTSEWYPVNCLTEYEDGHYGDFSPAFLLSYQSFLKKKYGTEKALQAAWNDPNASFAQPRIPTLKERAFIRINDKIAQAFLNFENADRVLGSKIELEPHFNTNIGVFLNPDTHQFVADFFDAWHQGTADTIIHFAKDLRAHCPDTLIGAFYGSYGCTDFFGGGTATSVLPILDSGAVDFLAAPGVYNNREPGGYVAQREMQDSFRLRNCMFVAEEDSRTHLEIPFYRDGMQLYTIRDTLCTLKRDFARNLCEDTYAWWFDQFDESGRYNQAEILSLFARQQEISAFESRRCRKKNAEIAIIYDQESVHYVSQHLNALMLDYYRTSDLGRIGAPVDYYFHNDMARPDIPDYKMYLLVNLFCLSTQERDAITQKVRKNGAMLVWLYAPGVICPDSPKKFSAEHISKLVQMQVRMVERTVSPRFRVTHASHPALYLADRDRLYGFIDRDIHSNVWPGQVLPPPYLNPGFYIEDSSAEILGTFCEWEKPAFALKKQNGYTSVYCAAPILRSELIASLAQYAKCHLYGAQDDCIYANRDFVCVHAAFTGLHTLRFPTPCSPYEVYEKKFYGKAVSSLRLRMHRGDTMMFSLCGEC